MYPEILLEAEPFEIAPGLGESDTGLEFPGEQYEGEMFRETSSSPAGRCSFFPAIMQPPIGTLPQAAQRWFLTGGQPPMPPVQPGNQVIPLVDGPATFRAMVEAIKTATSWGHFIYLIGWSLNVDFPLIPHDPSTTIKNLFTKASQMRVEVRAILGDQLGMQNSKEVQFINSLPGGRAIHDSRHVSAVDPNLLGRAGAAIGPGLLGKGVLARLGAGRTNVGFHHQKILIVKGSQGLIAFCGGVDISPTRIFQSSSDPGSPLHDVHCQIKGPAAHDLLRIFVERWWDHPNRWSNLFGQMEKPLQRPAGQTYVQICRTYGNGRRHWGVPGGYCFAPNGEQSIRRMVLHAISQARRFIYIEDQYLTNLEVSQALVRALPNIQHLTILIPHSSLLASDECPQWHHDMRRRFIAPLRAAGGGKVGVYYLNPPGNFKTYVHAKTWVIDDEFAIIGSANLNFRGYTHDSEVAAGIYDPGRLVKDLRIALWAGHLNINKNSPNGRSMLEDGVASARFWRLLRTMNSAAPTRVAPFNENSSISTGQGAHCKPAAWIDAIDPKGS
jgi:phosphatidylserine/phosphatidylglycerophosphate/cardiolipin synthase-like enzyme